VPRRTRSAGSGIPTVLRAVPGRGLDRGRTARNLVPDPSRL